MDVIDFKISDEKLDNVSGGSGETIYGTDDVTISGENTTFTDTAIGTGGIYSSVDGKKPR